MKQHLLRVLAWLSQGVNCILLGGHHDVTVSARAYLNRERSRVWYAAYSALNTVGRFQAGAYEIFVTQGDIFKVYTASGWIDAPLRIWDGSAWVMPTINRWNGTGWEIV